MTEFEEGKSGLSCEVSPSLTEGECTPSYFSRSPQATSISKFDLSGTTVTHNLSGSTPNLMPRIETIALYRKNAKKTNDPAVQFQLAQYMVQIALRNGNSSISLRSSSSNSSSIDLDIGSPAKTDADGSKIQASLFKEALNMLRKLADRGHADSQYLLGDIFSSCALGKPDNERSFKYFLMGAKHGHAEAAYRAALCLQEGWGTARDATRALNFYKTAAVRNQPGALYQLGISYFSGKLGLSDSVSNHLSGIRWLTRAVNVATDVYNRAPFELAKIYEAGYKDIVIPDEVYAAKLYARSAELNFVPAALKLGRAYEFGHLGCPQDAALSIHYYTIAAMGNDAQAQLSLAAWYTVGAGTSFPRNEDEAFEWALRAATNGLPRAQVTVAFFLQNGIGCNRDILEAAKWMEKAASSGDELAVKYISEQLPKKMNKKRQTCIII